MTKTKIGKTCVVCKLRYKSDKRSNAEKVCPDCMKIEASCLYCGQPMQKYKIKGGERKYCSFSCNFSSVPFQVRSEFSVRANETKRKNNPPKSHQNDLARVHPKYIKWRKTVYERDNYTCQDCGAHNRKGNGGTVEIHPHHIKPFATYPELRYDISNGVTLCKTCHRKRHNHVFIGRTKRASIQ